MATTWMIRALATVSLVAMFVGSTGCIPPADRFDRNMTTVEDDLSTSNTTRAATANTTQAADPFGIPGKPNSPPSSDDSRDLD